MKFTGIVPFFLYASLAAAKGKKPKFGGSGSGSSNSEEESPVAQDEQATETGFFAQATSSATSVPVGEVISSFYPTAVPTVAPSVSTALASGLLSVESSWYNSPEYTSADAAISRALPASLSASVSAYGYYYGDILTADWFVKGVTPTLQTAVKEYIEAVESVHYKYVDATATVKQTGSAATSLPTRVAGSGAAMITGAPVKMAGVVGVAALVAAVL